MKDTTTWLCKPGIPDNPCEPGFDTTLVSPSGQIVGTSPPSPIRTEEDRLLLRLSDGQRRQGVNSDLSIDPEERSIALYRPPARPPLPRVRADVPAAHAPVAIQRGSIPPDAAAHRLQRCARRLEDLPHKYNHGRGVVLIGHSQGTFVLRELIHQVIDPKKKVRKLLVSAVLLGGNVTVPQGQNVGGDFKRIPGCTQAEAVRLRDRLLHLRRPGAERLAFRAPGRASLARPAHHRRRALHESRRRSRGAPSCSLGLPIGAFRARHDDRARTGPSVRQRRGLDHALVPDSGLHGRLRLRQQRGVLQISARRAHRPFTRYPTRPGAFTSLTPISRSATSPPTSPRGEGVG